MGVRISARYLILVIAATLALTLLHTILHRNEQEGGKNFAASDADQLRSESSSPPETGKDTAHWYWKDGFNETSLKTISEVREFHYKNGYDESEGAADDTRHLLDELVYPSMTVRNFDFRDCRMSNCFDFSRCQTAGPLKVHIIPAKMSETTDHPNLTIGESNIVHANILKIIRNSKFHEPDADKACVFVPEEDTLDRDPLSQSFRPNIRGMFGPESRFGMNHLIFNLYSGSWPDYKENDFTGIQIGAAILAKASNSITHHRPGFDISLPLFSYQHPYSDSDSDSDVDSAQLQSAADNATSENRTFLLSFKGKRYVFGSGSETRNSLYHLHNEQRIVMLTTCRHGKKWRESSDSRCAEDELLYDQYDFVDLMKDSTFCLTPRGRRLGSFRYLESLSFGCIAVILSDGYVEPFNELIDWSCATVRFDESLLLQVPDMLGDMDAKIVRQLRRNSLEIYREYLSSMQRTILTTLSILEARVKNQLRSMEGQSSECKLC